MNWLLKQIKGKFIQLVIIINILKIYYIINVCTSNTIIDNISARWILNYLRWIIDRQNLLCRIIWMGNRYWKSIILNYLKWIIGRQNLL